MKTLCSLEGSGTIDGNCDCNNWWPWKGYWPDEHRMCWDPNGINQSDDRDNLFQMAEDAVPVSLFSIICSDNVVFDFRLSVKIVCFCVPSDKNYFRKLIVRWSSEFSDKATIYAQCSFSHTNRKTF